MLNDNCDLTEMASEERIFRDHLLAELRAEKEEKALKEKESNKYNGFVGDLIDMCTSHSITGISAIIFLYINSF